MTAMNSGPLTRAFGLPRSQLDDRVCLEAGIVAIVPDRLESDVGEGLGVHEKVADAQVLEHRAESLPVVHERFGPPAQLGCGEGRIGAN